MFQNLFKAILIAGVCTVIAAMSLAAPLHAQSPGPNLLVGGDFEAPSPWPWQDGIGEVQVGPGWRGWYVDVAQVPPYVNKPTNCSDSPYAHCYWMRPEFRDNIAASFANRVHGGIRSQKYFSYGRMHEGGLYQRVGGITPGTPLRFSIYIQAWQCFNQDKCGKYGEKSDEPADMHLRVGIDPYGGADPFSPNIIWSPEQPAFDRWVEFSVQAKALADTVTVFTHSRAEWDWARSSNDVYLDDASLVVQQRGGTPTSAGQPTAPVPVATPAATQLSGTPRIHIVVPGDTLYQLALHYNTTVEAIAQANQITNVNLIFVGQRLVIP